MTQLSKTQALAASLQLPGIRHAANKCASRIPKWMFADGGNNKNMFVFGFHKFIESFINSI